MKNTPSTVEAFNRELDRATQGSPITGDELSTEDQSALRLAQRLAAANFSESSAIRQTLRLRLAERAARSPAHRYSWRQLFHLRDGRALAGAGVAIVLVFIWAFGFFSPQTVAATPVKFTVAASPDLSGKPTASLTVEIVHNREFLPQPAPTPIVMPAYTAQASAPPAGTPVRTHYIVGSPLPIVTTSVSK